MKFFALGFFESNKKKKNKAVGGRTPPDGGRVGGGEKGAVGGGGESGVEGARLAVHSIASTTMGSPSLDGPSRLPPKINTIGSQPWRSPAHRVIPQRP